MTPKASKIVTGGKRHALGGWLLRADGHSWRETRHDVHEGRDFRPVARSSSSGAEEEAVELANATEFGLAAYFYTGDLGRAFRVMEGLEVRHGRRQ